MLEEHWGSHMKKGSGLVLLLPVLPRMQALVFEFLALPKNDLFQNYLKTSEHLKQGLQYLLKVKSPKILMSTSLQQTHWMAMAIVGHTQPS